MVCAAAEARVGTDLEPGVLAPETRALPHCSGAGRWDGQRNSARALQGKLQRGT